MHALFKPSVWENHFWFFSKDNRLVIKLSSSHYIFNESRNCLKSGYFDKFTSYFKMVWNTVMKLSLTFSIFPQAFMIIQQKSKYLHGLL